jgi:deferrochelatase/peroxidase EfeB
VAQAKGILPRGRDREVLYKNPRTCGYFIGVALSAGLDRAGAEAWLTRVGQMVDELVTRLPRRWWRREKKGEKVAAVAVGLGPSFFLANGAPRFAGLEVPVGFAGTSQMPTTNPALANVPVLAADALFYVASVFEARVNAFVTALEGLPEVERVTLERGYQREDGTEPFGYADGLRNIRTRERASFVFVDRDGLELAEPAWADGGSYMAYMKIRQRPDQFAALPDDAARDAVIGRQKGGTRVDLVGQGIEPREEPAEVPAGLPASSHVRKAGPRGEHDETQIFRRGLPFLESTPEGELRVGLNFCSFQASLEQFDVVFGDWMMSRSFPPLPGGGDPGVDALLDPARNLTSIEKVGFFFVPPHDERGLAAAVFAEQRERRREQGRLVVHKRVVDPSDPSRRFERRGFVFDVLDAQGQPIAGSQFTTDSTGRGLCPVELPVDANYTLRELVVPVPNVQPQNTPFTMDRHNKQLHVVDQVTQPNTPYAAG